MGKADEVESFLQEFKTKLDVWGIIFRDDRGKNAQTLLELEISPAQREAVLHQLEVKDFSDGPLDDTLYKGPHMWIFGRNIKSREVYIKITVGFPGRQVICISFHIAEHEMKYPLKLK